MSFCRLRRQTDLNLNLADDVDTGVFRRPGELPTSCMITGKYLYVRKSMARSTYVFDRWVPREKSTWAFRVFKKHTSELLRMYTAFDNARGHTYSNLGKTASWSDPPDRHFKFPHRLLRQDQFSDLKEWSNTFNDLANWVNLNALVAISSNLETYLATVIPLAVASDVGVLHGVPRRIDGIAILKHGRANAFNFEQYAVACTKDDWSKRLAAYERLFGRSPKFFSSNIASLERIRRIRNNVAHAFGRDIEASRNQMEVKTVPIEKLSVESLLQLQRVVWQLVKAIDVHLQFHIGEYQALAFYHGIYPELRKDLHLSMRAMELKTRIGEFGSRAGKEFCKGLVQYYEGL